MKKSKVWKIRLVVWASEISARVVVRAISSFNPALVLAAHNRFTCIANMDNKFSCITAPTARSPQMQCWPQRCLHCYRSKYIPTSTNTCLLAFSLLTASYDKSNMEPIYTYRILHHEWGDNRHIDLLQVEVSGLDLVMVRIEVELYKPLLYEEGAFFYHIAILRSQLVCLS